MKGRSALPKAPALPDPHHQIAQRYIQDTHCGVGISPLHRDAVGALYSLSRQGKKITGLDYKFI